MNDKPLLTFYGDDFTGSTDVMEALASNGVPTVLFMDIPSNELMARFRNCQAFGIAGTSRSETVAWMDENLPPIFKWLKSLDARHCHYKVCSTFDSSPTIGNIGRAAEIGLNVFGQKLAAMIVGAPQLKRYTAFGNLFAGYQGKTYRIDRHPVMSQHPVTPMHEADLLLHLAKQTLLETELIDLSQLEKLETQFLVNRQTLLNGLRLIDVESPESQMRAGAVLSGIAEKCGPFAVGSSGVEYALIAHWRNSGTLGTPTVYVAPGHAGRIAVVSGSVSPTTENQIRHAARNGFEAIAIDPQMLGDPDPSAVIDDAVTQGLRVLQSGQSPIIHTALGLESDKSGPIDAVEGTRHRIGANLGKILRRLVESECLNRAVIAGGDTSSHALKALDIEALTTILPLPETPGSPLCLAHSRAVKVNNLQIALKGGQVGGDDYFAMIRSGG